MATRLYKQHVHHLFSLSIFLYLPILTLHLFSFSVELFFFFLIQLLLSLCLLLSLLSSSFCPTIFATLCLPLCPLCLNLQHFFLQLPCLFTLSLHLLPLFFYLNWSKTLLCICLYSGTQVVSVTICLYIFFVHDSTLLV